jgi:hypothetical protein
MSKIKACSETEPHQFHNWQVPMGKAIIHYYSCMGIEDFSVKPRETLYKTMTIITENDYETTTLVFRKLRYEEFNEINVQEIFESDFKSRSYHPLSKDTEYVKFNFIELKGPGRVGYTQKTEKKDG